MLFNSAEFIFVFLPIAVFGFFAIAKWINPKTAVAFLLGCSLFFYGWWNPKYVLLVLTSLVANFSLGKFLHRIPDKSERKKYLILGIVFNLSLLGYYKYANFFVDNIEAVFDLSLSWQTIILPIAISFFTFEQIAYLVDVYRGGVEDYPFSEYCLFVIFFPQLIAGPIVHHNEILPQFRNPKLYRFSFPDFSVGATLFVLGLFKKVIIADSMAEIGTPIFNAADSGTVLSFFEAWTGTLAYTFQIYFDFSAYSEMALGLGRMFGLRLPLNFYSPYKAENIIDFWRRWHMTLSRFLRDYLYIPLGGNRLGPNRRYLNLMITMLLGGLWHGAGWGFVIWGFLHGFYLMINHGWRSITESLGLFQKKGIIYRSFCQLTTFLSVVVAWVFFRSTTMEGALSFLKGMVGLNGIQLPPKGFFDKIPFLPNVFDVFGVVLERPEFWPGNNNILFLLIGLVIVWWAPNNVDIMDLKGEKKTSTPFNWYQWRPSPTWATILSFVIFILFFGFYKPSEFIYFQF